MIRFLQTSIFESDAEAWVNPVNCVGIMGAGLAKEFAQRFPAMCSDYVGACRNGEVKTGKMLVFCSAKMRQEAKPQNSPKYIINFPTKRDWRQPSNVDYIVRGLHDLAGVIDDLQLMSVAIPALGCGKGQLLWPEVKILMSSILKPLEQLVDIQVFEPRTKELSCQ